MKTSDSLVIKKYIRLCMHCTFMHTFNAIHFHLIVTRTIHIYLVQCSATFSHPLHTKTLLKISRHTIYYGIIQRKNKNNYKKCHFQNTFFKLIFWIKKLVLKILQSKKIDNFLKSSWDQPLTRFYKEKYNRYTLTIKMEWIRKLRFRLRVEPPISIPWSLYNNSITRDDSTKEA